MTIHNKYHTYSFYDLVHKIMTAQPSFTRLIATVTAAYEQLSS
jgi:hypothetical protein